MSKPLTFIEYKPNNTTHKLPPRGGGSTTNNNNQQHKANHTSFPKILYICPFGDCVQARSDLVNRAMTTETFTVVGKEGFSSSQEYFRRHIAQKLDAMCDKSVFDYHCPFAECLDRYTEDNSTLYSREYTKSRTRATSWMIDHLYEHHASAICMRVVHEYTTTTTITTTITEDVKIVEKEEIRDVHFEDYNISLYNAPAECSFIGADMLWFVMRNMQFRCPECNIHYGSLPHFKKHIGLCIAPREITAGINPVGGYCCINSHT